jgi:hypothetical protein
LKCFKWKNKVSKMSVISSLDRIQVAVRVRSTVPTDQVDGNVDNVVVDVNEPAGQVSTT